MPAFLLPLLANPVRALTIAAFAALALFTGGLLIDRTILKHEVSARDAQITKLTVEKAALAASVENLNLEVGLAKEAQTALEIALTKQQKRAEHDAQIQKEIDNAPQDHDGPVAPVLRRAIERLQ